MSECKCGVAISIHTRTGVCRKCAAQDPALKALRMANLARGHEDPEVRARRLASIRATLAQPETKRRQIEGQSIAYAASMKDPDYRERRSDAGRKFGAGNIDSTRTPEARAKAGRTNRARLLAWCPEKYWPLNQTLKRKGLRLEARQEAIRCEGMKHLAPAAAYYLRRIGPITQCTEDGRPSALGRWWLYAGVLRSAAQIVRLAEVKGWKPPEDLASVA